MAQLTNLDKVRRNRARQKLTKNLVILAVFGLVVYGISVAVYQLGDTDIKTAFSEIKAEIATGTGYPISVPKGRPSKMVGLSDTLVLLSDSHIRTYSSSGRKMLDVQHGMANAVLSIAGDRIMLYDKGSTKMSFFSRAVLSGEQLANFEIYDADLSKNGNYAVAMKSDKHLARVSVYNSEHRNIFNCYSSSPIIAVSLADAKDTMAVGYVDAAGGVYRSRIARFQFSVEREINTKDLPGELILSLDYSLGNEIRVITDKRVVYFDNDFKQIGEYKFDTRKLMRFKYGSDGRVLLLMQNTTGAHKETAVLLNSRLKFITEFSAGEDIAAINMDEGHIYLVTKTGVSIRNLDGVEKGFLDVAGLYSACPIGDSLYYATAREINVESIRTLTSVDPNKDNSSSSKEQDDSSSSEGSESEHSSEPSSDSESSSREGSIADHVELEEANAAKDALDAAANELKSSSIAEGIMREDILSIPDDGSSAQP